MALGGWIGAMVVMLLIKTHGREASAAAVFAVTGGLVLTAVLQYGIGTLDGNYLLTALGAMLGIAATAFVALGLRSAFGGAGLGVAAVILILLGNPLSGLASAPELLPAPWGALGQLLPPGATGSLIRNLASSTARRPCTRSPYSPAGWSRARLSSCSLPAATR